MAVAEENENYIKTAAEQRLALVKQQLLQRTTEDSVIGRQLKAQKRKDLATQVQPLVAQVQLKEGVSGGGVGRSTPWGRMSATRAGKTGVNVGMQQVNWMASGMKGGQGGEGGQNVRYHTGRTTVLDKGAQWTTEGYVDNAEQPREQARQMVIRSLQGNTGMVYNKKLNSKSGETEWSGKMMEFGANGELTPIVKEDQKTKGERILAERFKQRSKDAASLVSIPQPPGIGG